MIVCFSTGILLCVALRLYLMFENKRRDKAAETMELQATETTGDMNFSDKTDMEMTAFRYVY